MPTSGYTISQSGESGIATPLFAYAINFAPHSMHFPFILR
jgi:hypothetical protein